MFSKFAAMSRRLRHIVGLDRAVMFSIMGRGWSIASGGATILLIAHFLSAPEQGYYYTFFSLVSLQTAFELGFCFVILQHAAHETAGLTIGEKGEFTGDAVRCSRLASTLQKSIKWYSVAAVSMASVLLIAGFHFFSRHSDPSLHIAWRLPCFAVIFAAMITFQMDPIFAFLEGCGFVPQVARMRFSQAVLGTTLAWCCLLTHKGLFAPAAVIMGQAISGAVFLFSKRRVLWPLLTLSQGPHRISWRTEIWPFQWRIGLSTMFNNFIFPLFSPVLFAFRGAAEAGRMGMSYSIANALAAVAYAWINTKASPFGNMIARREYNKLDALFFRTLWQSTLLLFAGALTLLGALRFAVQHFPSLGPRVLPLPWFAILLMTMICNHGILSQAVYLRAHKREPFVRFFVTVGTLTAISTITLGKAFGAPGVTVGYFAISGVLGLVMATHIFRTKRREWHMSQIIQSEFADSA